MDKRRRYGKLDEAMKRVIDEVLEGHWNRATTERLMQRVVQVARLPEAQFFEANPATGDLLNFGLYELLLKRLQGAKIPIELPPTEQHPNGRVSWVRALHNIPTGKPLDPRRADDPDAYAKVGLWVRTVDLRPEEVTRVRAYTHRHDGHPDEVSDRARETDDEPSS